MGSTLWLPSWYGFTAAKEVVLSTRLEKWILGETNPPRCQLSVQLNNHFQMSDKILRAAAFKGSLGTSWDWLRSEAHNNTQHDCAPEQGQATTVRYMGAILGTSLANTGRFQQLRRTAPSEGIRHCHLWGDISGSGLWDNKSSLHSLWLDLLYINISI